jgi:hypothetical protein
LPTTAVGARWAAIAQNTTPIPAVPPAETISAIAF